MSTKGSFLTMSTKGAYLAFATKGTSLSSIHTGSSHQESSALTGEMGLYHGYTPWASEGLYTATELNLREDTSMWTRRTHTVLASLNGTSNVGITGNVTADLGNYTTVRTVISMHYDLPVMIIVGVLLLLLTFTTAFGNLLVGLALFKFRQLKTVSNYLIGNLALSDFLLATTILPLSAVYECLGYWVFGEILCYFWLMADVLYCTSSIWNLAIIALDRFTATIYPLWYREKRSIKSAAIYIAIVWIFSGAICVPPLLGWNDITTSFQYMNDTGVYQCMLFQSQSYVMYSASGSFFIPFFITVFLYIRIFAVLKKRMQKMRVSTKSHTQKQVQKKTENNLLNNVLKKDDIELSPVPNNKSSSGPTEELSSKSLFGSGTDSGGDNEDEEDSSTQLKSDQPLYVSSSEAEVPSKLIRNGTKEKGSKKEKETLVILNPHHRFSDSEKDSDRDHIQIVVTKDNTTTLKSDSDLDTASATLKNNVVLTLSKEKLAVSSQKSQTPNKRKGFTNTIKNVNPFHRGQRDKLRSSQSQRSRRYDQREVRATIRMAIIIACFCGCWLGFFVIYVLRALCGKPCYIPRQLDAFFFWLGYSNSSMNPVLYAIFNEEFRRAFQKLLGCYKRNKKTGLRH